LKDDAPEIYSVLDGAFSSGELTLGPKIGELAGPQHNIPSTGKSRPLHNRPPPPPAGVVRDRDYLDFPSAGKYDPDENRDLYTRNYWDRSWLRGVKIPVPVEGFIYKGEPQMLRGSGPTGREPVVTILVHGTWAAEQPVTVGEWAHPDSAVAKFVVEREGGSVLSFQWSGRELDSARREAGAKLAEHIIKLRQEGKQVNFISHSHGGNVVKLALQQVEAHLNLPSTREKILGPILASELSALEVKPNKSMQDQQRLTQIQNKLYGTLAINKFVTLGTPVFEKYTPPTNLVNEPFYVSSRKDRVKYLAGWKANDSSWRI
jgi:hypothetical protein